MLTKKITRIIPALLIFLLVNSLSSQKLEKDTVNYIYEPNQVRTKGEYEGGKKQLLETLSSNLKYPDEAIKNNIQGKVIVKFVIEKDGTISNFKILKDIGYGCGEEIIRILNETQTKWNSAKINNKNVRSYYTLRVKFKIRKINKDESKVDIYLMPFLCVLRVVLFFVSDGRFVY
ncbi:energy transducer TonB [uncultured Apibacter sp.]|uniref:energy transducer TonB n=1 Tax=uncultured Apibacter sp. TaxID=1778616 RepID=UPI0025F55BBF|nr:energy transducer TonB [uncultured Apibacter sp.]